ncbi:hypothetical protein FRC16_006260, partial [Serendipita sp. 398]
MFLDPSEPSFGGNIGIQLFSWRGEGSAPHVLDLAQTRPSYDLPTLPGLEEIILIEADIGVIIKPETASLNRITGQGYAGAKRVSNELDRPVSSLSQG